MLNLGASADLSSPGPWWDSAASRATPAEWTTPVGSLPPMPMACSTAFQSCAMEMSHAV